MKAIKLILTVLVMSMLIFTGCQNTDVRNRGVDVIIDGKGGFPSSMAGVWKSEKYGWEIAFEPDGRISYAVIAIGRIRVEPGHDSIIPLKEDGRGVVSPGPWTVQVSSESRELFVEIVIKNYYLQKGDEIVEGNTKDIFIGSFSEDGRVWEAEWFSFPTYIVTTSTKDKFELPVDEVDYTKGLIIFTKVDDNVQ